MDRRSFVVSSICLSACTAMAQTTLPSVDESSDLITKAARAALALQRRDWEQGTLAQAFLESGDMEQVVLLTKAAILQKTADGRLGVVGDGSPTDPAMGGEAYWRAAQATKDPEMQQAVDGMLDWILHRAPRASDGTLYHVFKSPEVWSDGLFSSPPFLAATGHYDEALKQIDGFRRRLWNPQKKLLMHIVVDGHPEKDKREFWGGGNGWAAAGLVRVIDHLPANRTNDRHESAAFARDIIDGCLAHRRPDGLFHDVIDRPDTFVETNLAQMLSYAIFKGVKSGWLPQNYLEQARIMQKAARAKMDSYGIIQGACSAPYFDRPGYSTEAQAFFILMENAAH